MLGKHKRNVILDRASNSSGRHGFSLLLCRIPYSACIYQNMVSLLESELRFHEALWESFNQLQKETMSRSWDV